MFDAVIVAGASSSRLGDIDKAMLEVGSSSLLARAVGAAADASTVVVVGPRRDLELDVVWCEEEPAGGGPVAAFAAGLARTSAEVVLLLAADLPFVAGAVTPLLASAARGDVAVLVDEAGRANYLASAWQRSAAVRALGSASSAGRSMRSLFDGLSVVQVSDAGGWGADCDTWDAVAAARARADLDS